MALISITLTFENHEQALHVLEAYGEARGIDVRAHAPMPNPHDISGQREAITALPSARDLADGGTSKMYPTNLDGSIKLHPASPVGNGAASVSTAPAAQGGNFDVRGVPHNPAFHGENKTADGAWKRRRGHDKAAADAYEAQFVGKSQVGGTSAPAATALPNGSFPQSQASAAPLPDAVMPSTWPMVDVATYEAKWIELCKSGKVTGGHQQAIEQKYGGHPCVAVVKENPMARAAIYAAFMQWEVGNTAFPV